MAADPIVSDTGPDRDGAGEGSPETSPQLDLAGFAGPLAHLLALARAQDIDLREISLAALLDQLTTAFSAAGRGVPLAHKGDWLVMAAWLVWLRSRLLLPPDAPAQGEAAADAAQLRERLLALRAAQGLAAWLDARPQLGQELFARGAPEWLGTGPATAPQVDVVSFLWASVALFDDGARDADTSVVYRPPWQDLHRPPEARQRILALLDALPDGAALEAFLPAAEAEQQISAHASVRRRSAWASTLLAGLELAREGTIALTQEGAFTPVHLRRADVEGVATPEPIDADTLVSR
ncbi:MAG TPA: segregation/condensation protein A [Acetobacteraceae bacterium]|nr:segregation/condensation protein A [Acetobacteraceae bacterium]